MTVASILSRYSVSISQARDWILSHVNHPQNIFSVAKDFGLTNDNLAEIVGDGFTASDVRLFFSNNNIDASSLDSIGLIFPIPSAGVLRNTVVIHNDAAQRPELRNLLKFNSIESGTLSTDALAREVISRVGIDKYVNVFSPQRYQGTQDGVLSASDLGGVTVLNGPESFSATIEHIHDLFFGVVLEGFSRFDASEFAQLKQFTRENERALIARSNEQVTNTFEQMVANALATPSAVDHLSVADKQAYATAAGYYYVQIVGSSTASDHLSLVDGVMFSLLPW